MHRWGVGNLCLAAAKRAADGAELESIVRVIDRRDRTELFATLDTLEFLRRGGQVGNAKALLGNVLAIKPLIEVRDGVVEEAGRVRTRSRALRALAAKIAGRHVEHLAVLHGNADDVDDLLDLPCPSYPRDQIVVGQVGPVIGAHTGPGVIGVTYQVVR